jgi:ankyrin repeat protein
MTGTHDEPTASFIDAVKRGDAVALRELLTSQPALRNQLDANLFSFDAPALVIAASRNDRPTLDALLDAGANPNAKSGWWAGGFGALHVAADAALAEHLVSRGVQIDAHAAAHHGWLDKLRILVERTPALVHARGGDGQTPLHFAKTVEIAEYLLSHGAEIDARDVDHGGTPAQWAVKGRHDVVRLLMDRGATADAFMAAAAGDLDWLKNALLADPSLLRARVDDRAFRDPPGGGVHIYQHVIGKDATLLHAAALHDQPAVAEFLVAVGHDANPRGGYDDATPLHVAAWHNRAAVASKLLDLGADRDARSGRIHDSTPLGWAIVAGSAETVDVFLSRGAPMRTHYLRDAQRGAAGAFASYAHARPGAYAQIIDRLTRA